MLFSRNATQEQRIETHECFGENKYWTFAKIAYYNNIWLGEWIRVRAIFFLQQIA